MMGGALKTSSFAVPGRALPADQREHQPARPVVVPGADLHPGHDGCLADEAPQELLPSKETGLNVEFVLSISCQIDSGCRYFCLLRKMFIWLIINSSFSI